jgi:hypothetical protein
MFHRIVPIALLSLFLAACGDKDNNYTPDCTGVGVGCTLDSECCTGSCDETVGVCALTPGVCTNAGGDCQAGIECCSFSCANGKCSATQCVSDGESCDNDNECCGGTCADGSCSPLNTSCRTSGNTCTDHNDCCSKYCLDGICDPSPSYCRQVGDVCTSDFECCGGMCGKEAGAELGTCTLVPASGAGGCLSAGEVCGGVYDGGELPVCGGACCSRACLPYGPTNVLICQPPSGCRPTGEVCADDADCCGSATNPDGEISNVQCSKVGDNPLGRCDAGNACTPAGGICRLQSQSCNENANCCAGNVLQFDTCALDNLGIPRCLVAELDCADPSDYIGQECATSADCCGLPCTPHGSGEFPTLLCGEACVIEAGACTNNADCCAGLSCDIEPGASSGSCWPNQDNCSEYGQTCTVAGDCCNDLPCNNGTCGYIVN